MLGHLGKILHVPGLRECDYIWYIMSSHLSHNITHKDTAYPHCIGNENETEA